MTGPINGFARFTRPNSPFSAGYEKLVDYYADFAQSTNGLEKLMAKLQAELDKLEAKAKTHDSESLQRLIAAKTQQLKEMNDILDQDRDSYFSVGETRAKQVELYMSLSNV